MKSPSSSGVVIAMVVVLISLSIPGVQIAAIFDPERLRLIDRFDNESSTAGVEGGGSFLVVRGNAPLNRHGAFDPSLVMASIQSHLTPDKNLKGYSLIVISLVSGSQSDERQLLNAERAFWDSSGPNKNTENALEKTTDGDDSSQSVPQGILLHRPIVGSWISPPPIHRFTTFNNAVWNAWRPDDGAWDLAGEIRSLVLEQPPHPNESSSNGVVVYLHCMRGMDRTGLLAGAYMARYLSASDEEIYWANHNVARRLLNWPARNALRWVLWRSKKSRK